MSKFWRSCTDSLNLHYFLWGNLTRKSNKSKVEQIESRTASWNGLCSTFEGPLYFLICLVNLLLSLLTCFYYRVSPRILVVCRTKWNSADPN